MKASVSTHSRLKAAGPFPNDCLIHLVVSTHSRLKAAGCGLCLAAISDNVSTHSRLKAAGMANMAATKIRRCFNTQPPEGGWADFIDSL